MRVKSHLCPTKTKQNTLDKHSILTLEGNPMDQDHKPYTSEAPSPHHGLSPSFFYETSADSLLRHGSPQEKTGRSLPEFGLRS